MPDSVTLRDREGRAYGVPQEQVASYIAQGFRPETSEEGVERTAADTFHEEHGGVGGALTSGIVGGLSGLTLGGSDVALGALGADRTLRHLEAEHPYATGAGTLIGAIAPTILTGGAAAPEEAASIGARILAHSPAAMAGRVGGAIGGLGEGAGLVGRLAAGTAGAAAEGALYGGGQYLTETALEDKPLSAEGFVAGMGHGALFAAPIGAAGTLAGATLQRARSLFPRSEVSAAAAAGVKGEATSAIGQAVRDGDAMAQAAERKLSDVDAKAQIAQSGETVTRRVFGEAHPQALADQVAGAVDRQQVAQALEGYQQARQGVEDWIASEADPELEQALQGNKKFRAAFEKLGSGQPALAKMLGSAGPDDLETLLGQVGGRAPGDPQLDSAMRRLVDIPDATGAGGVPAGEFGAPGKGGFKSQDELAQLASGTDAEAAAREVRDLTAGRAARSEEGTAVLAKGTQPGSMGEIAAEQGRVKVNSDPVERATGVADAEREFVEARNAYYSVWDFGRGGAARADAAEIAARKARFDQAGRALSEAKAAPIEQMTLGELESARADAEKLQKSFRGEARKSPEFQAAKDRWHALDERIRSSEAGAVPEPAGSSAPGWSPPRVGGSGKPYEFASEEGFRDAQNQFRSKLTGDEIKQSLRFSREYYMDVNRALRGDRPPLDPKAAEQITPVLDRVLAKSEIDHPIVTHRAVHFDPGTPQYNLKPGDTLHDPGFGSTAWRSDNIHRFGNVHLVIESPAGTRIAPIPSSAAEGELTLARGTSMEITGREVHPDGKITLRARVVAQDGNPALSKPGARGAGHVVEEGTPAPTAASIGGPLEIRRIRQGGKVTFEAKLPDGSTRTLADRGEVAALAESELPQGWHLGNRFIETHRDLAIEHGLPKDAAGIRDNALYVARPSELADHGVIGGDLDAGRAERVAEARRTDIRLDPIEIKVDAGGRYWLDDGNHRLQEAAKSDAPVAIKFTPVKEFEWKGGSVDISERIRADLPVGARSAAPATSTLTGQLRGMQSKLGAGESLVEMGEPAREAYRAAKAERTTDAAEHYRGKAIAARETRAEVDESGFPIGFTREGGEWSGHRIFMDSDPVRRVNSASELPGFDSPEVTGKTRYAWVVRPSDLATRKLVARGAASEESISAIGTKWESGGQARPVIIHMEQAPKGMKGSRPPDQYYIHSGLDTLMAAARDGDRPVAIQFDRMNGYSAKGALSEDVLAATKRGARVPQGAEDLRVPAYNRYDQQLVDLAIKHGAKNLTELAAKPEAAAELRAIEDAYEATAARSPASTAHTSTPSAPEPPALSIRRPEIAHDQALERPTTDTLTGRLRGMQGKLDAGEGLAEMGRAPAAATRAEQKARAAEAAEHFRGEALAAREARAARHGLGDPAAPWNEGVPMAGAVETHDAPDPAFFARLTAPKTRDAYVAANIGRAMREEGSHAAALAKVEREWAERGGASASASADPLARFGLESDPSRLGDAASDVPVEVRAMALPERTAVDSGIKARMGGLRDEAAIAKAIMRHNGKGADMGPALARAAKAIGDMEDASARLTDVLGAEAPATAVENAKAYREALRGQQDRAAASAAKTAADLKTKVQPAADATIVDDDVTKALRQHDARVTAQASKSAPAAAPATGAAPSAAPAAAAAAGASVGGRLADVGSALEVLSAIGAHVPALSHIPVIGPILGLWLKARAVLGILGRKGGSIGKSTEGLIASKSAATRDRLVAATGALLEGGARAAGKVAHLAGPAVLLADALFPGGDKPASDKPRDLFEARTDDIVRAQQPGAIDQAIAQRYPTSDPAMHDAIVAQVQRGIAFLDGKRPKQTVLPGVLPGDGTWKPSTAAIDEFGKYVHAVNDPVSVFEDLAKGHPSAEGAETLRVVYPELYRLAQKELLQAAPAMATTLPYSRRVMISILYQIPVDGTMQPSHAQYLQAPAPPAAAPRAPATAGPLKLGQQTMSPLDQRASGA